jgi:hypothetical protein
VSNDAHFAERLLDVVGLYLDSSEHALSTLRRREESDPSSGPHPEKLANIDEHNEHPNSFVWTPKPEHILEKVRRARAVPDKIESE